MPPKQSVPAKPRGRPPGSGTGRKSTGSNSGAVQKKPGRPAAAAAQQKKKQGGGPSSSTAITVDDDSDVEVRDADEDAADEPEEEEEDEEERRSIPLDLLTRLLHESFDKRGTRITRGANAAVEKYFDIFVREAIARAMAERRSDFLGVEDLERMAPQLLLDL